MPSHEPDDPHWDRVVEIASRLWLDGFYVLELEPTPAQRLVDLQWAAHQAGRVLGVRAKIEIDDRRGPERPTVTVTVRYVDPDGKGLQRAKAGFKRLLRQVLADQP